MALTLLLRILIFTLFPFDVAVIDSNRRRTLSSVSAVPWGASARIFPSYHHRFGRSTPDYMCQKNCVEQSQPACQPIPGTGIDEAIGQLVVRSVTPLALEVALNVQSEIQQSLAEAGRLRQQLRVFGAAPERRDQARRGSASKRSPCGSGARRSARPTSRCCPPYGAHCAVASVSICSEPSCIETKRLLWLCPLTTPPRHSAKPMPRCASNRSWIRSSWWMTEAVTKRWLLRGVWKAWRSTPTKSTKAMAETKKPATGWRWKPARTLSS